MCSIFGAAMGSTHETDMPEVNRLLNYLVHAGQIRGRDGVGYVAREHFDMYGIATSEFKRAHRDNRWDSETEILGVGLNRAAISFIGNTRAEPTTEYVVNKTDADQQPYRCGDWYVVHNGTIANDKELRTGEIPTSIDSAAIAELLARGDEVFLTPDRAAEHFVECVRKLVGSYAILAINTKFPGMVLAACNYRPIWYSVDKLGTFFGSSRRQLGLFESPQMMKPYSARAFFGKTSVYLGDLYPLETQTGALGKVLVVCSGGMDSVVAAKQLMVEGYEVELAHFRYGSRAEGPEYAAIHAIANALDVPLHIIPIGIYDPADSPLLRSDSTIAGGEEGAEYAHEWVPARNLVMLSVATAFAEAKGFEAIALGNNLEEAGAYPDNEPEFIERFNDLLPFATGDGKRLIILQPVGNLMKHEIVALGLAIDAPLALTWSCYRSGATHCGTCGPCHMRKTAFEINGADEVIQYGEG